MGHSSLGSELQPQFSENECQVYVETADAALHTIRCVCQQLVVWRLRISIIVITAFNLNFPSADMLCRKGCIQGFGVRIMGPQHSSAAMQVWASQNMYTSVVVSYTHCAGILPLVVYDHFDLAVIKLVLFHGSAGC